MVPLKVLLEKYKKWILGKVNRTEGMVPPRRFLETSKKSNALLVKPGKAPVS